MLYWPFSAYSIQRTPYDPKALFIRKKKLVPGRRVTRLPELPWASQHFLYLLIKLGKLLNMTNKWLGYSYKGLVSPRWLGHPFSMIGSSSKPGQHFSIKTIWLTQPWSSRDNQSMRECCFGQKEHACEHWLVKRGSIFSHVKAR